MTGTGLKGCDGVMAWLFRGEDSEELLLGVVYPTLVDSFNFMLVFFSLRIIVNGLFGSNILFALFCYGVGLAVIH